jgi:hypothetical protein
MARLATLLGALLASFAVAAYAVADANSVAVYKTRVNAICRANTPAIMTLISHVGAAEKSHDATQIGFDIGSLLALWLRQDRQIYAFRVPPAARGQMSPILTRLHTTDDLIVAAVAQIGSGDAAGMRRTFAKIDAVTTPLATMYNGFGLNACGSQQNLG